MSGTSFRLTAAAAGAGMANFIAPMFSVFPNYIPSTAGDDLSINSITVAAPDVYILNGKKISTTGDESFLSLWTGTPDGGSVFSYLTSIRSGTAGVRINQFNDTSFGDLSLHINGDYIRTYKFDTSVPFPNASGTSEGESYYYPILDPAGNSEFYNTRVKLGSDVYGATRYTTNAPETVIEKLTDGVQQYVYSYYRSGITTTTMGYLFPFSDGTCIVVTNRGVFKLSSTGSVLWGRLPAFASTLDDYGGIVDPAESYVYSASHTGGTVYRMSTSALAQELNVFSVTSLSGTKTGNNTQNKTCVCPVSIDSNGNIWTIGSGSSSDTVACFQPNGTFVRKYSIDYIGNTYRIDLRSVAVDGDYLLVGGIIPSSTSSTRASFVAKLAIDGSSTGTGYIGIPTQGETIQISVLSSNTDGGSYSWSNVTNTTYTFARRTLTGYSVQSALEAGTKVTAIREQQAILL